MNEEEAINYTNLLFTNLFDGLCEIADSIGMDRRLFIQNILSISETLLDDYLNELPSKILS